MKKAEIKDTLKPDKEENYASIGMSLGMAIGSAVKKEKNKNETEEEKGDL